MLQELKILMSVVESTVTSLALIAGGLWAVFTFKSLRQIPRGRVELQKAEADLQKILISRRKIESELQKDQVELQKLQLEVKRQAVLDISIKASVKRMPNDTGLYVSAIVNIENRGSRNTKLPFEGRDPFSVTSVKFNDAGLLEFGERTTYGVPRASFPQGTAPNAYMRAGGHEQFPFFFRVSSPGLYFLAFTTDTTLVEHEVSRVAGATRPTSWVGKKYFVVE